MNILYSHTNIAVMNILYRNTYKAISDILYVPIKETI